jgi:hypothetical protein
MSGIKIMYDMLSKLKMYIIAYMYETKAIITANFNRIN